VFPLALDCRGANSYQQVVSSSPHSYTLETLDQISAEPSAYGVLGFPVKHSLSPAMQLAAFAECKIPAQYIRLEVPAEKFSIAVQHLKKLHFAGWNCTLPHKIEMHRLVDELAPSAKNLGTVNTVLNKKGHLTGYNTDGEGWVKAIREDFGVDVKDLRIMILGTGGAGQGLAKQAVLEKCPYLVLTNRTFKKAKEFGAQLKNSPRSTKIRTIEWDETLFADELKKIDLVVNTTSGGLKEGEPSVLPMEVLHSKLMIYDTIYQPTQLLEAAKKIGARSANGLSMLLHQGALAFTIWTQKAAPIDKMRAALLQSLESTKTL
jgi:shikimate dehydrogenase